MHWVVLTGSYPPDEGGIADYTFVIVKRLAELGSRVQIFTGPEATGGEPPILDGVTVHRLASHFTPFALLALERDLARIPHPYEILIQYVPQAFGPRAHSRFRGLPMWFCLWLKWRSPALTTVMLHETLVHAQADSGWRDRILHHATRWMLTWLAQAADRIFLSTEAWRAEVTPLARPGTLIEVLPVPSNVAETYDAIRAACIRADNCLLLGHFGTYREPVSGLILQLIPVLLTPGRRMLLIGSGSQDFLDQLLRDYPHLKDRLTATGALPSDEIAAHIAACDLMIQPYPDGVTSRRGTLMAAVALAKPVLTNDGAATEAVWRDSGAVAMVSHFDVAQYGAKLDELIDAGKLHDLGHAGHAFYSRHCSSQRTAAALERIKS